MNGALHSNTVLLVGRFACPQDFGFGRRATRFKRARMVVPAAQGDELLTEAERDMTRRLRENAYHMRC